MISYMTTLVVIYICINYKTHPHPHTYAHTSTHACTHTRTHTHTHARTNTDTHARTHTCANLSRVERAFIGQHITEEAILTDADVHVDEDAGEELTQEHRG